MPSIPSRPRMEGNLHEPLRAATADLLEAVGVQMDPDQIDRAVDDALRREGSPDASRWTHVLDAVLRRVGLVSGWRLGRAAEVLDEVAADLPVVTWADGQWAVVTRTGGKTRLRWHGDLPSTMRAALETLPQDACAWALIEPALPASILGGRPGMTPYRRLLGLLRAEREDLGLVTVYAVGVGLLGLATPVAVQVLVNTVAFGAFRQPLLVLTALLGICLGLAAGLRLLQRMVVEVMQRRVFVRMVSDLAERLPRTRLETFDSTHGPELVNRFFDVVTVQKALGTLLLDGLGAMVQATAGLAVLALYHPALLGFDLLLLFAVIGVGVLGRGATATAVKESKLKYEVAGWLEEIAAAPDQFKVGGHDLLAARRADVLARRWLDARTSHFRVFLRQYVGALALQAAATTILLGVGGWLVLAGQLSLGQLVAAELIVATSLAAVTKLADKLETTYDLLAALDKLGQLVDLPLEAVASGEDLPAGPPTLRARGVRIRENGAMLDIEVGQGQTGAVLATHEDAPPLAEVLLGLRDPAGGEVILGRQPVRALRPESLRPRVALVRDGGWPTGSLKDQIAMGRPGMTDTQVRDALLRAGLDLEEAPPFVRLDGPASATDPRWTPTLRARVAVARAIAGSPDLIVVEPVLDTLDTEVRGELLEALQATGATLILITHEPDLAKRCRWVARLVPAPVSLKKFPGEEA